MKIRDIIVEYREQYSKLDAFRQLKRGPDQNAISDFGDDKIDVTMPSSITATDRGRRKSTSVSIPDLKWNSTNANKQLELTRQQQHIQKVREIFTQLKSSIEQKGRQPFFSYYKDNTFGCGTYTSNGVKIGIGPQGGPLTDLGYSMDNVPQDEGKETIRTVMNENGFISVQSAVTKLRFKPKSQNLHDILNDFWNVVEVVESLGPDFKRSNRVGTGAGSLITGRQAPLQYYLWLANNIYESVRKNTDWGFSRGGGTDSGEGAYDRYDSLIITGITKGGIEQIRSGRPAYREHAVPADLINRMGIEICRKYPKTARYKNQVIKEIALMIHRNLVIVLCSSPSKDNNGKFLKDPNKPTEQEIIDEFFRTSMPPIDGREWKNGDDVYARFRYYDIPVYSKTSGKRMAE